MAESILRLKISSEEYDNKLKRASEQLTRYADGCRKAGGTLQYVDDGIVEFARSLGKMETSATSARGQLTEMTKAFTEWSVRYNKLTNEEKKGEFGKALNASLGELRGRIQDSKQELNDINKSINGGGGLTGALDTLSDKFGMSLKSLAGWGTALTAAKAALGVMSDAFFASESNVDEWGRVMDSSKSLYEGFLTALNTGDISGYLGRIDQIVQAARVAYNELDRLGTMKTIQAPQISAQQTENERMRMMIQTGRYIAPIDGRKNALFNGKEMQNGQLLTAGQIRILEKQLQDGMNKVVGLVSNEVKQTTKAIDAVYNRQAQELGISIKEFRKGTSSMAEFDNRIAGAANYLEYERQHTIRDDKTGIGHRDKTANPYEAFKAWSVFRVDGQRYNDLVKLIQQRDQHAASAYGMQSQAYRTMNRADGVTLRQLMGNTGGGSGGGKGGSGSSTDPAEQAAKKVADAEFARAQAVEMATMEVKNGTATEAQAKQKEYSAMESLWKAYGDAYNTTKDPKYKETQDKLAAELQAMGVQVTLSKEAQKQMEEAYRQVAAQTQKLASAQEEANKAISSGDLKSFYAADKKIVAAGGQSATTGADLSQSFGATTANIDAFIANLKEKISQSEVGTDLYNSLTAQLADASMLSNMIQLAMKNGVDMAQFKPQELWTKIFGNAEDIDTTQWEEIRAKLEEIIGKPITIDVNTGGVKEVTKDAHSMSKEWQGAGQAIAAVGNAMSQIEDPAAKVMGTIAQAIATIALAYAEASKNAAMNPANAGWGWIAFAAAGAATMMSTISAIHSATGYAQGGVVEGNTYSGDQIPAMLNAGEVVLNRAQQGAIASQLSENGGGGGGYVPSSISGEQIFIAMNRYTRRTGKGEIVTWK